MRGEFLDLSGARLYYYAAGTRGAGDPVVFLHGFPTSGHVWADVVPLVPAGHRVVVLDLLGYGRSDRPLDRSLSVDAHADRVIELFDQLRIDRACIVGHGLGGGIAQSIAVRHPARVPKLCLVASLDFDAWPTLGARAARAIVPTMRLLPPAALLGAVRRRLAHGFRDPDRASRSIDLYLRPFASDDGRDALAAHLRALLSAESAPLAARLSEITARTAIIWGQRDKVLPIALGHRLQRAIPGATLQVVDGRHFIPEEDPRPVADAIASLLARA
ncbi:MAG TPA: alpha/beta hydrolase [Gemmatimonadaceae bacterium]|nr:alpha/beta hydrolase [Gemmatimonadaceae bacterium]